MLARRTSFARSEAMGPSSVEVTSPGASWTSRNTMIETPNSTGKTKSRRATMKRVMAGSTYALIIQHTARTALRPKRTPPVDGNGEEFATP